MSALRPGPLRAALATLIGLHSVALGLAMLLVPGWMIDTFGFPAGGSTFFASQSGIFLLILGVCYLLALREPALMTVIVVSKAGAVVFLLVHALLGGPVILWAAAAGDAGMLAAVIWSRRAGPATARLDRALARGPWQRFAGAGGRPGPR